MRNISLLCSPHLLLDTNSVYIIHFAIFHPYQHKPHYKIQLKIYNKDLKNSVPLEQKTCAKYLGIRMDGLMDLCMHVCIYVRKPGILM